MKKFLILIPLLGVLVFSACGGDDTKPTVTESSCVICKVPGEPDFGVCRGGNGNAIVGSTDTGITYEEYISGVELAGANCE